MESKIYVGGLTSDSSCVISHANYKGIYIAAMYMPS